MWVNHKLYLLINHWQGREGDAFCATGFVCIFRPYSRHTVGAVLDPSGATSTASNNRFSAFKFKLLTWKKATPCSLREAEGRGAKPRWPDRVVDTRVRNGMEKLTLRIPSLEELRESNVIITF